MNEITLEIAKAIRRKRADLGLTKKQVYTQLDKYAKARMNVLLNGSLKTTNNHQREQSSIVMSNFYLTNVHKVFTSLEVSFLILTA